MDPFESPHWNLDQLRAWALTRDPRLIRSAALPNPDGKQFNSALIAIMAIQISTQLKIEGRDVDAELWAQSGRSAPRISYVLPRVVFNNVSKFGIPFEKQIEIATPKTLGDDCNIGNAREAQGPPHIVRRTEFPIDDYLLELFRAGRLKTFGFLKDAPVSRPIRPEDWSGLQMAVGGDLLRLAVWRLGRRTVDGSGDIENVRVSRNEILAIFPAEAPNATLTLDEVLLAAANRNGGTLVQATAEQIAREAGVFKTRDDLRNALHRLGIGGKQGRKKIRGEAA